MIKNNAEFFEKYLKKIAQVDYESQMASHLHDEWRKPRLTGGQHGTPDAKYEPRMKPTGLPDGGEVDIANTPYDKLPPKWQQENKSAGQSAIQAVQKQLETNENNMNRIDIEAVSSSIHDAWMNRNSWAKDQTPQLFVPYNELPEEEKEKDRVQARKAIELLSSQTKMSSNDNINSFDLKTPEGVSGLMETSHNTDEWNANTSKVKEANGGRYPSFWYSTVVMSGLAEKILGREKSKIKIINF